MIKCFIINLERRKDRLKKISNHFKKNNFNFVRFNAVDAESESDRFLSRNISQNGPLGEISKGDLACFQSHYLLWKHISNNEKKPVLILEDDTYVSNLGFKILSNINWIPTDTKIIKCEKFGNEKHRVLLSPVINSFSNFSLHFLLSKHSGTGGYILTPEGADFLVKNSFDVNVSVDHFLFNPNNSNIFKKLKPLQIYPAICEQTDSSSDIHLHRREFSYRSFFDFIREIKRGYYEIRLLPKQLFQLVFLKCLLKKIIISE